MKQHYIALLRGINVGGKNKLPMTELREMLKQNGFYNVKSYIQSGNISFEYNSDDVALVAQNISHLITSEFKYEIPVIILKPDEIEKVINNNPFIKIRNLPVNRLHLIFLDQKPHIHNSTDLNPEAYMPDEYFINDKFVYLYLPDGSARTKLTSTFFEKKLSVTGTTRNWNTVMKLSQFFD